MFLNEEKRNPKNSAQPIDQIPYLELLPIVGLDIACRDVITVTGVSMTKLRSEREAAGIAGILADIGVCVELFCEGRTAHGTDETEDGSIEPGAVVFADDGPGNAGIAVGIAAVEFVAVVEGDCPFERPRRIRRPFENLFGPIHAEIVVHPAGDDHLALGSVPEIVGGLAALELRECVAMRAWIAG